MGIDPARRCHTDHLGQKRLVLGDHLSGEPPCTDNFLPVVDVMQKGVDRPHPLFDPARQPRPFPPRDDPRDNVEGDQAFGGLGPAVDVKGNSGEPEQSLRLGLFFAQSSGIFGREPCVEIFIWLPERVVVAPHFVKGFLRFHTPDLRGPRATYNTGPYKVCGLTDHLPLF